MGMGEPLANYDAVWSAVERLHGAMGVSARHLTLSTVGIVPGIRRLVGERLPVNLAVSLHAANDGLRDRLVPVNRRYPLAALHAEGIGWDYLICLHRADSKREFDEEYEVWFNEVRQPLPRVRVPLDARSRVGAERILPRRRRSRAR